MTFKVSKNDDQTNSLPGEVAKEFNDFNQALSYRDSLLLTGFGDAAIKFYIFDEEKAFDGVKEYISIIKTNDLFIPETEIMEAKNEILLAANKLDFKAYYTLRSRIFNDIKFMILMGILTLFIITFLVLLFFLTFVRSKNRNKANRIKLYQSIVADPLSNLLFTYELEEIQAMDYQQIKGIFNTEYFEESLFKDTLIKEIIYVNKNLKGDFKDKLKEIYLILKLNNFSLKKLKSKNWEDQASGIVELHEMNIKEAVPQLTPLLQSKVFLVRTNAVRAYLHLSPSKDLKFLADQDFPLSRWQQMSLYRVIKQISKNEQVKVINLLDSDNPSIRVFGIKLVRLLGRMDRISELSKMYPIATLAEKVEILITFKSLNAFTELDLTHRAFLGPEPKLSVLAAELMGVIGDESSADLLFEKLKQKGNSFELLKSMMVSLFSLDKQKFETVVEQQDNEQLYKLRAHIKDSLLAYV
ncbi:hypothetical protein IFO69_10945 [Echinicola sp. CAU 1574]|uniref:HEAT repeat domain-containing protein n=2 Tax=Echinicola arenosa TaxID=2774144 RepID=A0ABR9AKI1_9BACT|nr:hypothetical protein [Echinicola arenosa]